MTNEDSNAFFESGIKSFFKNSLQFNLKYYKSIPFIIYSIYNQYKAYLKRKEMLKQGINIPPVMALSITDKCNLNCKGCYLKSQKRTQKAPITDQEIEKYLKESKELGVSIILLLGGEPLMKDVFKLTKNHKNMIFSMFTNSTLIDDSMVKKLKKNKHIIPILSMEGTDTNQRRGSGILESIENVSKKLNREKLLFGISLTVTRQNFDEVCSEEFVNKHKRAGSMFFSYFRYIPIDTSTMDMVLTEEQEKRFEEFTCSFREKYKTLILSPAIEKKYGGCLGAGKGVAHINYDGSLEVCPFAPFSDVSVRNMSIREALQSSLFMNLRKHHKKMIDNGLSMCTLWKDEKWDYAIKNNDFSVVDNTY
ncbi:MAG: radical SAM protein [Bacteroidetes bacterium]|nr:radical SAM protein [Bacteroidota bacterium]